MKQSNLMAIAMNLKKQIVIPAFLAVAATAGVSATSARGDRLVEVWRSAFLPSKVLHVDDGASLVLKVALGERLFRDQRLSGDGTRACISCHKPELGFTDGLFRARALPGTSAITLRNTPTLYNLATAKVFNWDGSALSLEQQVRGPIQNPAELAATFTGIVARLEKDGSMRRDFAQAFPRDRQISEVTMTHALASYVRSLRAPKTRFDAWVAGDDTALTKRQRDGFGIFVGKGGCVACHVGGRLSDDAFHDIGLPDNQFFGDKDVAGKKGIRAFKTPTLRAVKKTAPYMHNGSLKTLAEVVDHYADGIVQRRGVSGVLPPKLNLSDDEKAALVHFLQAL